jgi:hypothetical protein
MPEPEPEPEPRPEDAAAYFRRVMSSHPPIQALRALGHPPVRLAELEAEFPNQDRPDGKADEPERARP